MKKLFFGLAALSLMVACHSNSSSNSGTTASASDAPKMKFEKETHDFGKITAGTTVNYDFKFTNTGKTPLIVSGAQASCGCTIPTWPHTPIKPGEQGVIAVTFNSTGKMGLQDKQIVVTANTVPAQNIVHMIGEVDVAK
ncbi:MAG: DUF1573 domain-containing protein [Mucilaginibacter sp.]|jgi:hypothetical protein